MNPSFQAFLKIQIDENGLSQATTYAVFVEFLERIYDLHADGLVANIEFGNFIIVENGFLSLHESGILSSRNNWNKLEEVISNSKMPAFQINAAYQEEFITGGIVQKNIFVSELMPDSMVYMPNYSSYELSIGHHDPVSDVFLLGMLLASVVLGLDFNRLGDLEQFVEHRTNLFALKPKLHPSIAKLMVEMTELDRQKRPIDLLDVLIRLQNYKDFNPDLTSDLTNSDGFIKSDLSDKNQWILHQLKSRLFNLTRRNRLLYFKPQFRFLNLTVSSVPNEADVNLITPDDLFIWNEDIEKRINDSSTISLNKYLSFQEKTFLVNRLKKIGSEARKDEREFGFHQLKLAIAFLNWSDIDEKERIQSPLLLIPVDLVIKRGSPTRFTLDIQDDIVEVNPILAYALKDKYGIKLPDFLDLTQTSLDAFFEFLKQQAVGKIDGLMLNWSKQPKINLLHKLSNDTIYKYISRLAKTDDIAKEKIKRHTHYKIDNSLNENPFLWEMDTCNMVLGNFNYKKMSLVFDYEEIANKGIGNNAFDKLFTDLATVTKSNLTGSKKNYKPSSFQILTADPTQKIAIRKALLDDNESYVIQGPPGTGKSQTITNLIVNLVAHDKKVLFICEKRVALDVVFYKLEQAKLGELCCLVHDTKSDKKPFIMDLKDVYENYQKFPMDFSKIEKKRVSILKVIRKEWAEIQEYEREMRHVDVSVGVSLQFLFERAIYLTSSEHVVKDIDVPLYKAWKENELVVLELYKQLLSLNYLDFSSFPLHVFSVNWFARKETGLEIIADLTKAKSVLNEIEVLLSQLKSLDGNTVYELQVKSNQVLKMDFMLLNPRLISLLYESSDLSKEFDAKQHEFKILKNRLDEIEQQNEFWSEKLNSRSTIEALEFMKEKEGRFFSFFNGKYRKLKSNLENKYDFSKHAVQPTMVSVLENLKKENELKDTYNNEWARFYENYKVPENVFEIVDELRVYRLNNPWITHLEQYPEHFQAVQKLYQLLDELESTFTLIYDDIYNKSLLQAKDEINDLLKIGDSLDGFIPVLKKMSGFSANLLEVLKSQPISMNELELEIVKKTISFRYKQNPDFAKKTGKQLQNHIQKTADSYDKLKHINAEYIRASYRNKFNKKVWITEQSASVLDVKEKELKKVYRRGRRILENEFSKKMRYKSIRELTSLESKDVIFDLKPIWLMSPLSVSDVVPLDTQDFDVVIFDEASQITIEEGIPSLFRAKKAIIVGDEMQMPPTNFFGSKMNVDDGSEEEGVYLDVDSLLTQAARKMESIRLGWHYRSRHESLINFSNAAFYHRTLLTVPDVRNNEQNCGEILVEHSNIIPISIHKVLERAISYHYMPNGIYTNRSNPNEAEYIAHLVRKLLNSSYKLTIGIVAFSQKQQGEIENALHALAQDDEAFDELLEAEYLRHENGQYIGLFVKNLENVQGDERDIMILSICYGKNTQGRMRMNFGPINREGGEKRLNVIFSRAKKHMAVITSIQAEEITNDYNPGANYFKQFLKYASEISKGNGVGAQKILDSFTKLTNQYLYNEKHIVAQRMGSILIDKGYVVDYNIGQSDFICHLAVKRNLDDASYLFGILIDDELHYSGTNIVAQNLQKPILLEAFGWKIYRIYQKDWWDDFERVLLDLEI